MRLNRLVYCAAAVAMVGLAGPTQAAPTGGFYAVLDSDQNNSDSSKAIVVYDVDDPGNPLFAMYVGWKGAVLSTVLGTTAISGDHRSPDAFTVDPATGNMYVLARDSDDISGSIRPNSPSATNAFAAANIPDNTEGDYDILKFDFAAAYNHWEANQATYMSDFGETYVTFVNDPVNNPPVNSVGTAPFQNASRAGSPANKNEVLFEGFMTKVGEVASSIVDATDDGDDQILEFVDEDTLLLIDSYPVDLDVPDPETGSRGPNDIAANDREIKVLRRVSTSPGAATNPSPPATSPEGGWNRGTTESWEATVLGRVNLDFDTISEVIDAAWYRDPVSGVMGLWITESDPAGDVGAFFEVQDFDGDDTGPGSTNLNAYRTLNDGGNTSTVILFDDNPVLDDTTNDGQVNGIHVNPLTGAIYVIETGVFDVDDDEPSVLIREITTYDNGLGEIVLGDWSYVQLDMTGLPDDDGFSTESRRTVYDYVNNEMYFYDFDNNIDPMGGGSFVFDWYRVDLDTGLVTFAQLDVDESTRGFGTEDRYEFFFLGGPPAGVPGDVDGDGDVDLDDFDLLTANYGMNVGGGASDGDFDNDGDVDFDDFITQAQNMPFGGPDETASTLPEPATLSLLALAAGCFALRRRA